MDIHFYNIYDEKSITAVQNYSNLLNKLRRNKLNLHFNRTCKRHKIIPNYIKVHIKSKSYVAQNAKRIAENTWLANSIKTLYTKINMLTIKIYNAQLELSSIFHRLEYENIIKQVDIKTEKILKMKRKTIRKKLKILLDIKNSKILTTTNTESRSTTFNNKHKFYKRIHNTTNISLNEKETSLLNMGLKHNITPYNNVNKMNNHILNIEGAILKTKQNEHEEMRTLFINEFSKKTVQYTNTKQNIATLKVINSLKKKLTENDAVITKADKGNTLVIINKSEYNQKIDEYIINNNIMQLPNDPTKVYHSNINKAINKSMTLLNKSQIFHNKMLKPRAPILNGLPKIHKPDTPIRPLINFTTSPTYKIAKHVNHWLTRNIHLEGNMSIKNNLELIDKIQSVNIPTGAKLASFDVSNMYSNIPVMETIKITSELLRKHHIEEKIVDQITELLHQITRQNYFQHNDKFYTQPDGLPMGSPLSGTLANIYLNHIEHTYIINDKNKLKKNILYWYRYVDDILILFQGTNRQLEQLQSYINNIHQNIKFTLEVESEDKTINFLDLTIKNDNQKHNFKIYRKPTQTDHTIHKTSNHPYQHKLAAYNHMITRLNNIPMKKEDYEDELNTIKYIAHRNGYNEHLINRMNVKIQDRMQIMNLTTLYPADEKEPAKYITVEYNKMTNNIMSKILRQYGYTIAFKTNHRMQNKLKNKPNRNLDSGVYKLICNDCPMFYIGQTGRTFNSRFKEHTDELNINRNPSNIKSNYAQHLASSNHTFTDLETNLKVLYKMEKGNMMNRLEEIEIYKEINNPLLMNDKINTKTNKLYDFILNSHFSSHI